MAQSFSTNLYNVADHYLQALNARVTKTTLKENLEENPYYPSLYSLSNVLNRYNIVNEAYSIDEGTLSQFEPPFITYCSAQSTGKDFVLVTKITETTVNYIADGHKPKHISREEFLRQWQKVVFVAEAKADSGEHDYAAKLKIQKFKERKQKLLYTSIGILIGLIVYLFLSNTGAANIIAASAIVLIKLLGVGVTTLLLIYEIDKTNSFVKNICNAGKQINCNAVINSKAGKILGMSWGEVGFFYFASTALLLLFPGLTFVSKLPCLAMASTLAAPYILFSIYYQWRVVKQWCPLCLAVQAVLVIELIWSLVNFWFTNLLPISSLLSTPSTSLLWGIGRVVALLLCLLLPIICWYLIKPILLATKTKSGYNSAYKRLLYNPEIFKTLLQQQTTAPDGWQTLGIDIGNPNATNTILKVCNPYCGPCAKAHPVLEEIIKNNSDVKVKVIFTASNNEDDEANKPVKHLLAIASKENLKLTSHALDDWYLADKKDYEVFAAKYPMNGELKEQKYKLGLMKDWCDEAEITGTPTIFINSKRLPDTYSIDELKNIF